MKAASAALCLFLTVVAQPAAAAPSRMVSVPPGDLASAIVQLGGQAGVTIGIDDSQLARIRTRGVHGRMSIAAALSRLLAGSAADFVSVDAQTFRIVARRRAPAPLPPPPVAVPSEIATAAIVVTGSKRAAPLQSYAGSVQRVDVETIPIAARGQGTDALLARIPVLASTHLGPGRNKLFVRGIADSSFNGPTQSTVGEYLGEVRLNYNAPDPDLALYDIASAEVLEGPQGTLYGAGSLGGILRLVPVSPDLDRASGSLSAGSAFTTGGAPGGDAALIANLPIVPGRLALRTVAYASLDGGYIDDPSRGLVHVNRTKTDGGRATLRYEPSANWSIDLGGVVQNITTRDGQYALKDLPPLQRTSVIAQPFDNDYALASLVVRHSLGALHLVSASSAVFHDVGSTYDASVSPATSLRYVDDNAISLLSNETRLSHEAADGSGWVLGLQMLHSRSRIRRTLGPIGIEPGIAGTLNTVDEISLYGEGTLPLTGRLSATAGGRIAYDRLVGQLIDEAAPEPEVRRQNVAALPSAGLLWKAAPRLAVYARYQEGYRAGGLSVQAGRTQRFEADSVATWEAGLRYGTPQDRFGATAALSYAHWEDVQADLVGADGLPYTANIGSGRVLGLEVQAHWRPIAGASIEGALFANDSSLYAPAAAFAGERDASLPNIADLVAQIRGSYAWEGLGRRITVSASLRYVGRSRLGVGPSLDLHQGRYLDTAVGIGMPVGPMTLSLDATNLANARRNIFALGNPFGVMAGDQTTPLRPRTIRIGASVAF